MLSRGGFELNEIWARQLQEINLPARFQRPTPQESADAFHGSVHEVLKADDAVGEAHHKHGDGSDEAVAAERAHNEAKNRRQKAAQTFLLTCMKSGVKPHEVYTRRDHQYPEEHVRDLALLYRNGFADHSRGTGSDHLNDPHFSGGRSKRHTDGTYHHSNSGNVVSSDPIPMRLTAEAINHHYGKSGGQASVEARQSTTSRGKPQTRHRLSYSFSTGTEKEREKIRQLRKIRGVPSHPRLGN